MPSRILEFFRNRSKRTSHEASVRGVSSRSQRTQLDQNEVKSGHTHADIYFKELGAFQEAVSSRDYHQARRHALEAMEHVPGLVDEWGDPFSVESIPPLETGGLMFALLNDQDGIEKIKWVASSRPQLERWHLKHIEHEESRLLFRALEELVAAKPGILQSQLKRELGEADGRRISVLVAWLEKAGRIKRERSAKTHALYPPSTSGTMPEAVDSSRRDVVSHRKGGIPNKQMINWSEVDHVPLPHSPSKWELESRDDNTAYISKPFELSDTDIWTVLKVEKLAMEERPDPAFRHLYSTNNGVLALDDLGKSVADADAAAIQYGRDGAIIAKRPLSHGVYRLGVSATGAYFICLSREHVAHAYDETLRLLFETDLAQAPELVSIRHRLGIDDKSLHTHIRSVGLSDDAQRYLFTVVDEAWCVDASGKGLWGLGVPLKDGYKIRESEAIGTRSDIQRALNALDLALPLASNDVKQRYRALAKEWHPDVNSSPGATARMKEINHAFALLTGLEADALVGFTSIRTAYKESNPLEFSQQGFDITMSITSETKEVNAADWIYASAFATGYGAAYIATYSGKVLSVDATGKPIRYYTIGNVPRRIIDTGDYLYLLTDTRLYVLRNDTLVALVDISDGGDIIVAQTGFGLLEKKRFRWFDERGILVATVLSKNPLRRIYWKANELIIETRTQRLRVGGARPWWD